MTQVIKKISFSVWFFIFSLVLFLSSVVSLPGAEGAADQADVERYSRDRIGLERAITRYHQDMNKLFNQHIKNLFKGGNYVVEPPEDKECSDNKNVSTYCLAIRATAKYEAFVLAMETHRSFLVDKGDDEIRTLDELSGLLDSRIDLIDRQILVAEEVMSATLATYDQLQVFYPLHVEYQDLIVELERYRDGLADVRKETEKYPGKFHDVTTTECT